MVVVLPGGVVVVLPGGVVVVLLGGVVVVLDVNLVFMRTRTVSGPIVRSLITLLGLCLMKMIEGM
jgi:hypothetical protein